MMDNYFCYIYRERERARKGEMRAGTGLEGFRTRKLSLGRDHWWEDLEEVRE